jgi:outer membrane immunogenic protein
MRKILFVTAVALLAGATGPVFAADLPAPAPAAPPPPPPLNWTGIYVGGQVGLDWGQTDWDRFNAANTVFIANESPTAYANKGVIGGGHVGYNYQVDQFVFGVEGDVEGTNYFGSGQSNANTWANTTRVDVEASFRARAGVAFDPLLIYLTGGGAYADFHNQAQFPAGTFYAGDSYDRLGWTAGIGVDYAIDANWSVRTEYRFTDFGQSVLYTGTEAIHENNLYDNRVEAGFSYKFDMFAPPAPVVAKY